MSKILVTGGAGFIGSHVVDHLLSNAANEVVVYDDLRTGNELYLERWKDDPRMRLVRADVLDLESLDTAMKGCDTVVHFQANADVRGGVTARRIDLEQNTIATWNACEAASRNKVKAILFASSATVYGEPEVFPTPEDISPVQTSLYGASKLAGEAMIQAYSEYFNIRARIYRFVSWTGPRYSHGVVYDFFRKLCASPGELEILGDGKQRKSYLDVRDGIAGIFTALENEDARVGVYNLGHDDWMPVTRLADIVCDEMGLQNVEYKFTGGERGWIGDSPFVHLDTTRLKKLGWKPTVSISQSIRDTVQYLVDNEQRVQR